MIELTVPNAVARHRTNAATGGVPQGCRTHRPAVDSAHPLIEALSASGVQSVLVVDRSPTFRRGVRSVFAGATDIDVTEAGSLEAALAHLAAPDSGLPAHDACQRSFPQWRKKGLQGCAGFVDVVIFEAVDLNRCCAALSALRARAHIRRTVVIAESADAGEAARWRASGADAVLARAISPAGLAATLILLASGDACNVASLGPVERIAPESA